MNKPQRTTRGIRHGGLFRVQMLSLAYKSVYRDKLSPRNPPRPHTANRCMQGKKKYSGRQQTREPP
jgi:hypothetical protein